MECNLLMDRKIKFLFVALATIIFLLMVASTSFSRGKCPQTRKTKAAPTNIALLDNTGSANVRRGKLIYEKKAKTPLIVLF